MSSAPGRFIARAISVLLLGAGLLVVGAPADACSCAPVDVRTSLAEADGAFVGRWIDRAEVGDQLAAVTFEVDRVVKGSFGPKAIVRTNAQGSACGLELLGARRTGLILDIEEDGVWGSGLCSMVPPAELLAMGNDHPPDPGVAPVSVGLASSSKAILVSVGVVLASVAALVLVWWKAARTTPRREEAA